MDRCLADDNRLYLDGLLQGREILEKQERGGKDPVFHAKSFEDKVLRYVNLAMWHKELK